MKNRLKVIILLLSIISSLSAMEITKTSGDARFYYGSSDSNGIDLFSQESATGQFSLAGDMGLSFSDSVSANLGVSYLTTMGLENSLVTYVFAGGTAKDQLWLDEVNLDVKLLDKTDVKIGRQYISSPMLYSINWNIVSNAMDGAYIVDNHIEKTKIMALYVGRVWSNDYNSTTDELNFSGNFKPFGDSGAFGVGAKTEIIPTLSAEFWYYDISRKSTALWAQAQSEFSGVSLGAQYAIRSPKSGDSTSGYAFQAKYTYQAYNISGSFSQMGDDGSLAIVNLGGVYGDGSKSPLYTEAWWNWGYVGSMGTTSYALKGEAGISDIYLGTYLTQTSNDTTKVDTTDFTVSANTSLGGMNYMLVYIYIKRDDFNNAEAYNTVQGYLTYNF